MAACVFVAGDNTRHLSEPAMLLSLDNDAVTHVLSHLTADELARFVCARKAEESKLVVDEDAHAEPEYSGTRLRMPYLTPWTTAEVEKRAARGQWSD